ncbi:MAG: cell division protein ZapA [Betaproteobacteria bacterium]
MAEAAGGGSRLTRVRVTIAGTEYTLRTDESPKQVEKLANRVDRELRELSSRFPGVTLERLAVLLALRLTGQLERAKEQARAARKAPPPEVSASPDPSGVAEQSGAPSAAEAAAVAEPAEAATASSLFDPRQGD